MAILLAPVVRAADAQTAATHLSTATSQSVGSSSMTQRWYRDYFADYFNLQKDHWDESWGWAKYNDPGPDRFEFGKMMSAGALLLSGIDDSERVQGGWDSERFGLLAPVVDASREVEVLSRDPNSIDLLYRDNLGKLRHRKFSGTPWNVGGSNTADVVVSDRSHVEERLHDRPSSRR
jgi:hypothetical protein